MTDLQDIARFEVNGWAFIRRSDGSIVMIGHGGMVASLFSADEWASVVASMSLHGDTARAWAFVRRFHDGRWTEAARNRPSSPKGERA